METMVVDSAISFYRFCLVQVSCLGRAVLGMGTRMNGGGAAGGMTYDAVSQVLAIRRFMGFAG